MGCSATSRGERKAPRPDHQGGQTVTQQKKAARMDGQPISENLVNQIIRCGVSGKSRSMLNHARVLPSDSIIRLGLGSLKLTRRTIAAPSRGVFLSAVVPSHGAMRPFMGVPCGTPSGVLFPCRQSANPHGLAHLLAEVCRDRQSNTRSLSHER